MSSTSSHIKADWFFSFKKAQNPPYYNIFMVNTPYTASKELLILLLKLLE